MTHPPVTYSLQLWQRVIDAMLELGLSHNNRTLAKKAFELALKEELPRVSRSRRERLL